MPIDPTKLNLQKMRRRIAASRFYIQQVAVTPAGTCTMTVNGGAAGTAIGIDADADSFNLTKSAATARTSTNPVAFTGSSIAIETLLAATGTGTPLLKNVNSSGKQGFLMTAGDMAICPVEFFNLIDRSHPIRLRAVYATGSSTALDTHTWIAQYAARILESTAVEAVATALDTAIAVDTDSGSANTLQATPWGIINGGSIGNTVDELDLEIELDATDAGESIYLLGVDLEFTAKLSQFFASYEGEYYTHASP